MQEAIRLGVARDEFDVMITFRGKVEKLVLGNSNGWKVERTMRRSWSACMK